MHALPRHWQKGEFDVLRAIESSVEGTSSVLRKKKKKERKKKDLEGDRTIMKDLRCSVSTYRVRRMASDATRE